MRRQRLDDEGEWRQSHGQEAEGKEDYAQANSEEKQAEKVVRP
jgi:hypothetical protein